MAANWRTSNPPRIVQNCKSRFISKYFKQVLKKTDVIDSSCIYTDLYIMIFRIEILLTVPKFCPRTTDVFWKGRSARRFWHDLGRRLARLPSPSVCPALFVPARIVSHAPGAARAAARRFAWACPVRPSVHQSHARAHTSRQSYFNI